MAQENDLEKAEDAHAHAAARKPPRRRKKDAKAQDAESEESTGLSLTTVAIGVCAVAALALIAYFTHGRCWGTSKFKYFSAGCLAVEIIEGRDPTRWAFDMKEGKSIHRIHPKTRQESGDFIVYKPVGRDPVGEPFLFTDQNPRVGHFTKNNNSIDSALPALRPDHSGAPRWGHPGLTELLNAAQEAVRDGSFGEVHVILAMGFNFTPHDAHLRDGCPDEGIPPGRCFGRHPNKDTGPHLEVHESVLAAADAKGITVHIMNTYHCKPRGAQAGRFHRSNNTSWTEAKVLQTIGDPNPDTVNNLAQDFFNVLAKNPDVWLGLLCHKTC